MWIGYRKEIRNYIKADVLSVSLSLPNLKAFPSTSLDLKPQLLLFAWKK